MKKFVWKKLFEDFPDLYGGDCFDFSVRDGWYDIVYRLSERLKDTGARCVQCKQKFGGLRYYYIFIGDDETAAKVHMAIEEAETAAWKTCESCGNPGTQVTIRDWVHTLCPECSEKESRRSY